MNSTLRNLVFWVALIVVGVVLVVLAIEVTVGTGLFTKTYHVYVEYPTVEGLPSPLPGRWRGVSSIHRDVSH